MMRELRAMPQYQSTHHALYQITRSIYPKCNKCVAFLPFAATALPLKEIKTTSNGSVKRKRLQRDEAHTSTAISGAISTWVHAKKVTPSR
jgi:hypothetical protein